ncbi:MAG: deoxyhypusine synthase family protein [Kofleriaceae bacterium]|nr:deoxyhypusine synthase family protein [Kofleriaceae bacterium]
MSTAPPQDQFGAVKAFVQRHFRHFNAAAVVDAAEGWNRLLADGGKMFLSMAGAMSTAELGCSLAEMIRQDKVHAICCTGANLEEDLFNLLAHDHYVRVPGYRTLRLEDEQALLARGLNRVTDTCIPEVLAMNRVEELVIARWRDAQQRGVRRLPHEFLYDIVRDPALASRYQIDPRDSWLIAAAAKDLPIFVPGWEDSTLGNVLVARTLRGDLDGAKIVKSGLETMQELVGWYRRAAAGTPIGFFQIGGGIAGDFPICVVPLINQDLKKDSVPLWAYFCQISDSTTSYGSYSGAEPGEKITWGKLGIDTPMYVIESDATIVAPLMFAYVLAS